MAKGVIGVKAPNVKNILGARKVDTVIPTAKAQPMESLIPTVKGQDVPQPKTDWGSGKVTGPKATSGIIRPSTKSKKGW